MLFRSDRFGTPYSPTHQLESRRHGDKLEVTVSDGGGDVEIFVPVRRGLVSGSLLTHTPASEDGYFMLTLSPGRAEGTPAPRDIAVVVDVSGSMSGEKMEQARQALHRLLGTLRETQYPVVAGALLWFDEDAKSHRRRLNQLTRSSRRRHDTTRR